MGNKTSEYFVTWNGETKSVDDWVITAAKRKELLRRIVDSGMIDPITHEPGECEDCDLMREVVKELADD